MVDIDGPCLELRVARLAELGEAWLDGFAEGGVYVPGAVPAPVGAHVTVRVVVEELPGLETLLGGVVVFRRTPSSNPLRDTHTRLVPGAGVVFDPVMRPRVVFLERIARGVLPEHVRRSARWPLRAYGEVVLRADERACAAEIVDVSTHGAQIALSEATAYVARGAAVRVWTAYAPSGESSFAPLSARVAWISSDGARLGVELDLQREADRVHWERVVARARSAFERRVGRPSVVRMAV